MITYQYFVKLGLVLTVFAFLGITGVFQSPVYGISNPITIIKADRAVEKGDKEYGNRKYTAAFAAYQQAADIGSAYGQFMLANMYLAGESVKKNPEKYMYWIRQSADNGYSSANYLLGMAYLTSGPKVAAGYFKKAAGKEHGSSMHMLGLMYAKGAGVTKNTKEALKWFRLAKAQGIPVMEQWLSQSGIETSFKKRKVPKHPVQFIKEIQQRLTNLGYRPGRIDGLYGNKTRGEIQAFQRKMGLQVNGLATIQVLDALKKSSQ